MTHSTWDELASGWEQWREHLDLAYRPVREWLLTALDLAPGDTLLELAAGTGSAGFDAIAAEPRATLISTDLAPGMVDAARRRAAQLGLTDVGFETMDATRIALEADSIDRVLCESGFMLMPHPTEALRETRRVLRPGGRLALSVWGPPEDNPWDAIGEDLLVRLGHLPAHEPDTATPTMADVHHTTGLLHDAGFDDVQTAEIPVRFGYTDLDEWERWSIDTNTIGPAIRALSPDEHATFRDELGAALAPYRTASGYELPGLALCVACR